MRAAIRTHIDSDCFGSAETGQTQHKKHVALIFPAAGSTRACLMHSYVSINERNARPLVILIIISSIVALDLLVMRREPDRHRHQHTDECCKSILPACNMSPIKCIMRIYTHELRYTHACKWHSGAYTSTYII